MIEHSRRTFLTMLSGGLAGGLLGMGALGSCGSGGGGSSAKGLNVIRFFPDGIHVAGRPERLPLGLAGADATPLLEGPKELRAVLSTGEGTELARLVAPRRSKGLPRAYYAFEIEVDEPGLYALRPDLGGADQQQLFTVLAPGTRPLPAVGDPLRGFDTPTVKDPRGVDPICTRPERCPFHDISLNEALAAGRPVAYLVGTPAHCQTAICGPVLDLLIEVAEDFPQVSYVHSEVYADDDATVIAPAVLDLGLEFEPLLFLAGAEGTVQRRLDVIYDRDELRDALAVLTT